MFACGAFVFSCCELYSISMCCDQIVSRHWLLQAFPVENPGWSWN